jgi:hypothetical protein
MPARQLMSVLLSLLFIGQSGMRRVSPAHSKRIPESGWPEVCYNATLKDAIDIIDSACNEYECDASTLKQLDTRVKKPLLLTALRDPQLRPIHIFFNKNEPRSAKGKRRAENIDVALHWSAWKHDQVETLTKIDPRNSVVYVIGQASKTGSYDYNYRLSQRRMQVVIDYLKKQLHVECQSFRGGWLSNNIFQLTAADADFLDIKTREYDNDEDKLNQAVHVFVFPCADRLKR